MFVWKRIDDLKWNAILERTTIFSANKHDRDVAPKKNPVCRNSFKSIHDFGSYNGHIHTHTHTLTFTHINTSLFQSKRTMFSSLAELITAYK